MSFVADTLRLTGLDTLSERALRRLTDRWTGELSVPDSVATEPMTEAAADSVVESVVEQWRLSRELYHDAAVESLLGDGAYLAEGVSKVEEVTAAGDGVEQIAQGAMPSVDYIAQTVLSAEADAAWWHPAMMVEGLYNVLVAAVLLLYIYCMYRYFDDIVALFDSIFGRSSSLSGRSDERRRSDIFYGALGKLFMLGAAFVGLLSGMAILRTQFAPIAEVALYMPFMLMGLFLAIVVVQYMLLGTIGAVTRSLGEVSALMRIRLTYFVLSTVMVAPVLLVAMVSEGVPYKIWFTVGQVGAVVALILFLRESIKFFIQKKVSILHWILYLCTVEILPFSLLWQAVKSVR